jgi:hypothetical protein
VSEPVSTLSPGSTRTLKSRVASSGLKALAGLARELPNEPLGRWLIGRIATSAEQGEGQESAPE